MFEGFLDTKTTKMWVWAIKKISDFHSSIEQDYLSMQKKRVRAQTELILGRKQACDTGKNQTSDEDMRVGCLRSDSLWVYMS